MENKSIIRSLLPLLPLSLTLGSCTGTQMPAEDPKPNVVIIFFDDAGWGDFAPFWQNPYPTPHMKQLASEGRQFHNFYVPQAVCSASRAALLSGAYPCRTGLHGAHEPNGRGLEPAFAILPELLKANGYVTGGFGKWHIGDQEETRPFARGFDEYSGIMYSNDMWAGHPENPQYWGQWPLRYWENGEILIDSVTAEHQTLFTTWITEKSVDFIHRHKDNPFFLYVPHPQPHVPLFVSEKFEGKSGTGLYGDVIMELDWSVGQIMEALKMNGLDDNTIVLVTSDNGPWLSYGNHSGKTPFREGKTTSFDGGIRSALLMKYPGHLEAGSVSSNTFFSIDLLPTLAHITGTDLPENEIDGKNVWDLVRGETHDNPQPYYAVSLIGELQSIISSDGRWKLHIPHSYRTLNDGGKDGIPGTYKNLIIGLSLFDMVHDPFEKSNVITQYPEVAAELMGYAQQHLGQFYTSVGQ
jgi:arylsulfatase A